MGRMTVPVFPYRNKQNGLVGKLTAEQAAVFPNLERVVLEKAPIIPVPTSKTPLKASK